MRAVIYVHGKGGSAGEADRYRPLFPDHDVIGFDYSSRTPWEADEEFAAFADDLYKKYDRPVLIANSIGAYYSMHSLCGREFGRVFFISPITDMEKLITDMITWAGTTEEELREKKEIPTAFGETLSWEYLSYVRSRPCVWDRPAEILYGENDGLTSFQAISAFAERTGSRLTVMKGGEHWFHTAEQLAFLDSWIISSLAR